MRWGLSRDLRWKEKKKKIKYRGGLISLGESVSHPMKWWFLVQRSHHLGRCDRPTKIFLLPTTILPIATRTLFSNKQQFCPIFVRKMLVSGKRGFDMASSATSTAPIIHLQFQLSAYQLHLYTKIYPKTLFSHVNAYPPLTTKKWSPTSSARLQSTHSLTQFLNLLMLLVSFYIIFTDTNEYFFG